LVVFVPKADLLVRPVVKFGVRTVAPVLAAPLAPALAIVVCAANLAPASNALLAKRATRCELAI
jgi:hypothetical protein